MLQSASLATETWIKIENIPVLNQHINTQQCNNTPACCSKEP